MILASTIYYYQQHYLLLVVALSIITLTLILTWIFVRDLDWLRDSSTSCRDFEKKKGVIYLMPKKAQGNAFFRTYVISHINNMIFIFNLNDLKKTKIKHF